MIAPNKETQFSNESNQLAQRLQLNACQCVLLYDASDFDTFTQFLFLHNSLCSTQFQFASRNNEYTRSLKLELANEKRRANANTIRDREIKKRRKRFSSYVWCEWCFFLTLVHYTLKTQSAFKNTTSGCGNSNPHKILPLNLTVILNHL